MELGLLVDTLAHAGRDAIAQVDVGERIHRNQPLANLSLMAYGIMQVAFRRLSDTQHSILNASVPHGYTQFGRTADGRITEKVHGVEIVERPPLCSLKAA